MDLYFNLFFFLFWQMAAAFNEISGVKGNIPLGCFNAMFNYTGSWQVDAASTKSLAVVGYFNRLYEVKLAKLTLFLCNEIKRAVPSSWDPASLARYTMFPSVLYLVVVDSDDSLHLFTPLIQFYRKLRHSYCNLCDDWWKRRGVHQTAYVFSFTGIRNR